MQKNYKTKSEAELKSVTEELKKIFREYPTIIEKVPQRQLKEECGTTVSYSSRESYGLKSGLMISIPKCRDDDLVAVIRTYHTKPNGEAWHLFSKSLPDKRTAYNLWLECLYGEMARIYPEYAEAISRRLKREMH